MTVTSAVAGTISTVTPIATRLPARRTRASVEFRSGGALVAHDGLNTLSGYYGAKNSQAFFEPLGSTFAGYVGNDPGVLATRSAFSSVFTELRTDREAAGVTLAIQDAHLIISSGDYSLVLEREDLVPTAAAARRTHPGRPGP